MQPRLGTDHPGNKGTFGEANSSRSEEHFQGAKPKVGEYSNHDRLRPTRAHNTRLGYTAPKVQVPLGNPRGYRTLRTVSDEQTTFKVIRQMADPVEGVEGSPAPSLWIHHRLVR